MENLIKSLIKAKKEFKPIIFNRSAKITESRSFEYADLSALFEATEEALLKHGLVIVQILDQDLLKTKIMHESGESIESNVKIELNYADPKKMGASITYMKRYAYAALLCLSADEDQDAADSNVKYENIKKEPSKSTTNFDPTKVATEKQIGFIRSLCDKNDALIDNVCKLAGVKDLIQIPMNKVNEVIAYITKSKKQKEDLPF